MTESSFWLRRATVVLGLLGLIGNTALSQYPALSSSEIAKVEREVTEAIRTYYRLFSERNARAVGERVFDVPWILVVPEGVRVFSSPEETTALFEDSIAQILPRGWERSDLPSPKVCVLSLGAATVSGTFYRYKKDGSVLSQHGVTYLFARTPEGWRIASMASHPPGRAVGCTS